MPEYLAPGVFVEEVSYRAKSIEGVSTTTTAFIGATRSGPVDGEPEILTSFAEKEYLRRALEVGASGFLLKGTAAPALAHAVRLAKDGVCTLDAGVVAELAASSVQVDDEAQLRPLLDRLSPREMEVLSLLERGYSNRAIAAQIHYSVATVKNTVRHILEKLEVKSRAQAALLATRAGLIPPEPSG